MPLTIQSTPTSSLTPDQDAQRWRQLIQYVNQLEQRLNGTLPVAARQQGPVPGWQLAGQIGPGAGLKSSMHLHLDGNQQGQAPRTSITDPNGVVRAEMGNLAANGVSPAQWGFRASDASGSPIFDSLGLIAVMKLLGSFDTGISTQSIVGPATGTTVTGPNGNCTVTFSLARQQSVLTFYFLSYNSAGTFSYLNAGMDGDGSSGTNHHVAVISGGATSPYGNAFWARVDALAAGSHTALSTVDVDSSTTCNIFRGFIKVFGLGA